jgi:hypothetical protein
MSTSPAVTADDPTPTADLPPSWSAVLLPLDVPSADGRMAVCPPTLDVPSADGRVAVCPPADEGGTITVRARPTPPLLYLDHFDDGAADGDATGLDAGELVAARNRSGVAGRIDELTVRTDRDGGRHVFARGTFAPDPPPGFTSLLAAAYRARSYVALRLGVELDDIEVEEGGTEEAPMLVFASWRVIAAAIVPWSAYPASLLVLDQPLMIGGGRFWHRPLDQVERAELHSALITDPPEDDNERMKVAVTALRLVLAPGTGPGTWSHLAARMSDATDPLDMGDLIDAARRLAQL